MKTRCCKDVSRFELIIHRRIDTGEKALFLCCEEVPGGEPGIALKDTAEENLQSFLALHEQVSAELIGCAENSRERTVTASCAKCYNYRNKFNNQITYVNLSMYPSPCQARCVYCKEPTNWRNLPEVKAAYEKIFEMLELAEREGVIAPDATWQVSPGEITIHPYRERIIRLVQGYRTDFYTNAFVYDEDIARHLHDDPASRIKVSLDAGTVQTWEKVKGVNNFKQVIENLERYLGQCVHPEQIMLKYILLPGINDFEKDYQGLAEVMKKLGSRHLEISRDKTKRYSVSEKEKAQLLHALAGLLAVCLKNCFTFSIYNFTDEEIAEAKKTASSAEKAVLPEESILKTSNIRFPE